MALTPNEARAMAREAADSPEDYAARGCVICPHCGHRVEGAQAVCAPRWLFSLDVAEPEPEEDQPR